MAKNTLMKVLSHEKTRDLMGRLARGEDPRLAVAQLAGVSLAEGLAKAMGAGMAQADTARNSNRLHTEPEIVDAEFREINVTEQAKKASKK